MTADEVTRLGRPPVLRRLVALEDISELAAALAEALSGDPLASWLAPEQYLRERMVAEYLRLAVPYNTVYSTKDREGAAIWLPPGAWRAGLPRRVASTGIKRMPGRKKGLKLLGARRPKTPHYYLAQFGVEPEAQGGGIGTALLSPMLRVCDGEAMGAYLETANREVLPLLLRHGFMVTDTLQMPADGPQVWLLWRSPAEPQTNEAG